MANEKRPSGSPGPKRRRPPTVIDLPATEIPTEPTAPQRQAGTAASPPADPVPPEAAASAPSDAPPFNPTSFDPNPTVLPPADAAAGRAPADPEPVRSEPPPPPEEPPSGRRLPFAFMLEPSSWPVAGIAGVAGALMMALLFWLFGALSGGHDVSADLGPRLAAIEKQLNEVA